MWYNGNMNEERKRYTFLHILLVGAIALIANLFVFYSLEVIKPSPKFENICTEDITLRTFNSEDTCTGAGGQWTATPLDATVTGAKEVTSGYCNATYSCQKIFNKANEEHSSFIFVALTVFGGILFLFGITIKGSSVVGNGLSLAGLMSIFWGSIANWTYLYPLVKVALLGALLMLIVWFAWNKFKD